MKITKLPNGGTLYELSDGVKYWYLNDNHMSQAEFERLIKLKGFW